LTTTNAPSVTSARTSATRRGPPPRDVVEGDAVHLVRPNGAPLFSATNSRRFEREPEGGVAGELGLADRQRLAPDPRPVHVAAVKRPASR
jgi:hypothetical protein